MCQEVSVSHDSDLVVVCGNSTDPPSNTNCGLFKLVEEDLTCLEQELAVNCFAHEQSIKNSCKFFFKNIDKNYCTTTYIQLYVLTTKKVITEYRMIQYYKSVWTNNGQLLRTQVNY